MPQKKKQPYVLDPLGTIGLIRHRQAANGVKPGAAQANVPGQGGADKPKYQASPLGGVRKRGKKTKLTSAQNTALGTSQGRKPYVGGLGGWGYPTGDKLGGY